MSTERRLMVDWHGLKRMGWPYSKAQTQRLEESQILAIVRHSEEREFQGMVRATTLIRFPGA